MSEPHATTGWVTSTPLRFRDFDYLGHMTATSYLALLEEARVAWLAPSDPQGLPSYVVAQQSLTFHREILPADGPVQIEIRADITSSSHYEVSETITGRCGHVHATSHARLVAWDRELHRPRDLTDPERRVLQQAGAGAGGAEHTDPAQARQQRQGES